MTDKDKANIFSLLFHWFECNNNECGHLNAHFKLLRDSELGKEYRTYKERIENSVKKDGNYIT